MTRTNKKSSQPGKQVSVKAGDPAGPGKLTVDSAADASLMTAKEIESQPPSPGPIGPQLLEGMQDPKKERPTPAAIPLSLEQFVKEAWHVLEPVAGMQWNWHLSLLCEYLTVIRDDKFKDRFGKDCEGVIFNVPPRTMKSLLITVFFPVWLWTTRPELRFMFVSYSEKLSTQHSVFRRSVIESSWYREHWRKIFSLSRDQNMKGHYQNSRRGLMFSTTMQGTATGVGGDILVFDDPLNPEQAFSQIERESVNLRFDSTFRSRINDPSKGVKIVIMQRLHEMDLTGHLIAKEAKRWQHVCLPAITEKREEYVFPSSGTVQTQNAGDLLWPGRLSKEFLDGQRGGMGSWAFSGQYQQAPAPMEGGIVKRQWVRFYRQLPERFDFMVQSWDCTFSGSKDSDFVAGQVWGKSAGKYYMLPYRLYERLDFGPTMAAIKACHGHFPQAHAILIEDKANGPAIISELQKEIPGIIAVTPDGGKVARAQAMAPLWESGSIELPDPQLFDAPWVEQYIHNICTFPKAAHDDDMDATSQALSYMRSKLGGGIVEFYRNHGAQTDHHAIMQPDTMNETALARNVVEAISKGHQVQCNVKQWPAIRRAISSAAANWNSTQDVGRFLHAGSEIIRLDRFFHWTTPEDQSAEVAANVLNREGQATEPCGPSVCDSTVETEEIKAK